MKEFFTVTLKQTGRTMIFRKSLLNYVIGGCLDDCHISISPGDDGAFHIQESMEQVISMIERSET